MSIGAVSRGDIAAIWHEINRLKGQLRPSTTRIIDRLTVQTGGSGTSSTSRRVLEENESDLSDRSSLNFGTGLTATDEGLGPDRVTVNVDETGIDHGALAGLSDDDHPQYAQIAANEDITARWNITSSGSLRFTTDTGDTFDIIDNPATGNMLVFPSGTGSWSYSCDVGVNTGSDITVADLADEQFLVGGTGGIIKGINLTDFSIRAPDPAADYLIYFDDSQSEYSRTLLENIGVTTLSGLSDTTITAGAAGDILMHNGSAWIDATTLTGDYTFSGTNTFSGSGTALTVDNDAQIDGNFSVGTTPKATQPIALIRNTGSRTGTFFGARLMPTDNSTTNLETIGVNCQVTQTGSHASSRGIGGQFKLNYNTSTALTNTSQGQRGGEFVWRCTTNSGNVSLVMASQSKFEFGNSYAGTVTTAVGSRVYFDDATSATFTTANAFDVVVQGTAGMTYTNLRGLVLPDLGVATNSDAIRIASQATSSSATKGNINMLGGNWNTGHLRFENGHIWYDQTLECWRVSKDADGSAPTAEDDGFPIPLAHAEIYGADLNNTIAIVTAGKANRVQITSFNANGQSFIDTPDHTNDHITILDDGIYLVACSIHLLSAAAGGSDSIGYSVYVNNGATELTNLHGQRDLSGGGADEGSISMSGLASFSAGDTVEVWIWNNDSTDDVIVDDINLSVVRIK